MVSIRRKASKGKGQSAVRAAPARGMRERKGGALMCLNAYVAPDLGTLAKVEAARRGVTMSQLVADALGAHLGAA